MPYHTLPSDARLALAAVLTLVSLATAGALPAQASPGAHAPGTSATLEIDHVARAYFVALVAGKERAAYTMLAPCPAVIHLSQGMMGLPGRGAYQPGQPRRVLSAYITGVRVRQDATLRRGGLMEALVDGTFRFHWPYPYNEERSDGHHIIVVLFTHCGGQWRLYAPWGGGGPYGWH